MTATHSAQPIDVILTCRRCNRPMAHGKAMAPALVSGASDFADDIGGGTLNHGTGQLIDVWKCSGPDGCGRSVGI